MRCTYYYFFDTMEEDPLNEFFVLKQNENVEIDCLQALALGHLSRGFRSSGCHSLRFDYPTFAIISTIELTNNVLSLKIYRQADCFSKSATPHV